ncbi:MAG: hypothetical protein WB762_00820 [Candidatus Sulfotelmatobacter sp.]
MDSLETQISLDYVYLMNFAQLRARLKLPDGAENDWHRHENTLPGGVKKQGGWVENTASVAASVFLGEDAVVGRNARVEGKCRIDAHAA